MESLRSLLSAAGRIAPRPFVLGVLVVYVASFLSQFLLAAPVTARANVIPFVVVQVVVAWAWYVLHVRRLRDAGRHPGSAVALTILYGLAIVLLLLVMLAANGMALPESNELASNSILRVFLLMFLVGLVIGDSVLGVFGYVILGALILVMLPILIAIVFTIWLATRPSTPATP